VPRSFSAIAYAKERAYENSPITCRGRIALCTTIGTVKAEDVIIAPEQETVIREYVTKHKVVPVEVPADVRIEVGSTLPDTVELYAIDVPDIKFRCVVVGKQTILVEPETRKIDRVLESPIQAKMWSSGGRAVIVS
jgi:Protein of unknown function (DUF1236)